MLLEWQVRPATQLLQGTSEDQRVDGGRIGDAGSLRTSIFDHGSSLYKSSVAADKESSTQPQENIVRRRRILETYLSERRYILKCSEYLIFIALFTSDVTGRTPHGQEEDHSLWLKEAGANIVSSWISHNNESTSRKHPVVEAVDALRLRLESVTKGSGWLSDEGMQEDIELAFARSQILESIHIMQITLSFLLSSVDLLKSTAVLSWFRFMKDTEFYDGVQLVSDEEIVDSPCPTNTFLAPYISDSFRHPTCFPSDSYIANNSQPSNGSQNSRENRKHSCNNGIIRSSCAIHPRNSHRQRDQ